MMNDDRHRLDTGRADTGDFARLPPELSPDPALEERVVRSLLDEQLLRPATRRRRLIALPVAAAAGIALFVSGLLAGYGLSRWDSPAEIPAPATSEADPDAEVRMVFWL